MSGRKNAYLGLLIALAFIFSYIEFLIPINLGIPGIKLGLANLVVIVALYTMNEKDAFLLSMVRILLVGFTFGNLSAMLYSLAGGLASFAAMLLAKRTCWFSQKGVSVLGGIFHNVGQILTAMLILETSQLIYYLPVLMISGIVSGALVGGLAVIVADRVKSCLSP